jgi:ornithine cyclodeaminase/alanine dehydrogenase-like protein (mu-crystallin family)
MALVLTQKDLKPLVDDPSQILRCIEALEAAVLQHSRGEAGQATYLQFSLPDGPGMDVYSTSGPNGGTVRVFPQRAPSGALDNQVMLLFERADGRLLAVVSGDDLNTLRTSLPAVMGAKHLAPPGANSLCILGSGQQAAGHIRGLSAAFPSITDMRVYSPTPANRERFARDWSERLGRSVKACSSAEQALRGADVIASTAHVQEADLPKADWVKPGAVITTLVGAPPMSGLRARAVTPSLKRPQTVFPRMMKPAEGGAPPAAQQVELAAVMRGEVRARERDEDIVLYSIAAPWGWDAPVLRWAYDWALARDVGISFDMTVR